MAPNFIALTKNGVSKLMNGEDIEKPIFQVLDFKKILLRNRQDYFTITLSDGTQFHSFAILSNLINVNLVKLLVKNCLIQVDKIFSNVFCGERVVLILQLTVLSTQGCEIKLGNPVPFRSDLQAKSGSNSYQTGSLKVPESCRYTDQKYATSIRKGVSASDSRPSTPIRDINPYISSNVLVRARVTSKSPINSWSNSKGSGKLFKMDLLDESGEIRMTTFNNQVDGLYDFVKVGCVYTFRNFGVKEANKNFSMLKNDYELIANQKTKLARSTEVTNIPLMSFDFMKIANIEQAEKGKVIDVIGVCKKLSEVQTFTANITRKQVTKRDITLVDETNQINLTLWGKQAEDFGNNDNPVVAVKRVKVSDFNGKSISCTMASTMLVITRLNPDLPEAHTLRKWYADGTMHTDGLS